MSRHRRREHSPQVSLMGRRLRLSDIVLLISLAALLWGLGAYLLMELRHAPPPRHRRLDYRAEGSTAMTWRSSDLDLASGLYVPQLVTLDPETGEFTSVKGPKGFETWEEAEEAGRFLAP